MLTVASTETVKKRKTEDPVEVATTVKNPTSPTRRIPPHHDHEIRSLTAWSSHCWVFNLAEEPAPQLIKALQKLQREQTFKGTASLGPPRRALCDTLAKWLVPRLPQQSPFDVFLEKITKPEEIEALWIQMFVARLTKRQDKFLVRIRPHLAARAAWNEAISTLDDLARSQGPQFAMAQTYACYPRARARARERRTTTIGEQTKLQHWLRRSGAADMVHMQRVPFTAPAPRSPSRLEQQ